jgi:hypothetical protein
LLAVSIVGVLIVGFERPFKRLGTLVHGWNFIWSICLALFILLELYKNQTPLQLLGNINRLTDLLVVGAVGNAICATFGIVLVVRGGRSASNVILSITAGLITVALAVLALGNSPFSLAASRGGGVALIAASFASLLESAVVLAGRSRSTTRPDT